MRLGDYADAAWMFVATCDTCDRQARVDPAEVLTHPNTHPRMRVAQLAIRLRCRDCRHRTFRDNKEMTGGTSRAVTRPAARRRLEPSTGHGWPLTVGAGAARPALGPLIWSSRSQTTA